MFHLHNVKSHPEVITAGCQNCLVSMELLLPGDQGDIAEQSVFALLIKGREDRVLVGFGLTQPLSCQHVLRAETQEQC